MLPKDTKARLLAISIAIVYFLFNVYAINTFVINTETYATYFFVIALVSAILAISFGFFIEVESVSTGLILGGLILLIYSSIRFWWFANNKVRVIILAIALCVLVVIGFKLFEKKDVKKK